MTTVKSALLSAALMSLAACAGGGGSTPTNPTVLMATAWAEPWADLPDSDWSPRLDGECRNKVAWVMERCQCGQMLIGYINLGRGRIKHAALLVDGMVYDVGGVVPLSDYPMTVEEVRG